MWEDFAQPTDLEETDEDTLCAADVFDDPVKPWRKFEDPFYGWLKEARLEYEKQLKAWQPLAVAVRATEHIAQNGGKLDQRTMDDLRARHWNEDLGKVIELIAKELKKSGYEISTVVKGDDIAIVVKDDKGNQCASEMVKGHVQSPWVPKVDKAEYNQRLEDLSDQIADEIKKHGRITEKAAELMRQEDMHFAFNDDAGKRNEDLSQKLERKLKAHGYELSERKVGLNAPSEPIDPRIPRIGGGTYLSAVHVDLIDTKEKKVVSTTFRGTDVYREPD